MTSEASELRDLSTALILDLCPDAGGDAHRLEAELRHLAIAALNVGADALPRAGQAMGWLALFLRWHHGASVDHVVEAITRGGLVRHLSRPAVEQRLLAVEQARPSQVRRSPGDPGRPQPHGAARSAALTELARLDEGLQELMDAPAYERPDAMLNNVDLLAAIADGANGADDTNSSFAALLPSWPISPGGALRAFAAFERHHLQDFPASLAGLGERPQRFETSLATHLDGHGLLPTLRAALAFAPAPGTDYPEERALRQYLTGFSAFADDPTRLELTLALMEVRGDLLRHLRGATPLAALAPWIDYLRGPCAHFAEARDITLREATNFAHYALHLINLFDAAADDDLQVDDRLRRAMMDIEDELKEFALVGQQAGLSDDESNLARYERSRWRTAPDGAPLADRIARLCGAFTGGHRPGPLGCPPRPDHDLYDRAMEIVSDSTGSPSAESLARQLAQVELVGYGWLLSWEPTDVLALLRFVGAALAGQPIDNSTDATVVDLRPVGHWLTTDDLQRRREVLRTLLHLHLDHSWDTDATGPGLVANVTEHGLVVSFETDPEVEALLTLLARADDPAFAGPLVDRLARLLGGSSTDAGDQPPAPLANGAP